MAAVPEKEKDMIVKEPREDDVLLGQGHYRHQGNQKLNKIVDGKVDEYKNQSRVFKTYMAHDIINRMRSKGVRFLKELAPKGWIVVKDDKEAREKVAQRFQYMMRKQAEAAKAAARATPAKTSTKQKSVLSASTPSPRPNLSWHGITVKVPFLPVFHQLQKSSVMVDDDINEISGRLLECFEMIGVRCHFDYEQANAALTASDNVKMHMNLWKPLGGNRGVIVELLNLEGDVLAMQKYNRYILEAATGLFDRYKHNLFQSGATASVKDHVTAFTATRANGGLEEGRAQSPGTTPAKAGMFKVVSNHALHDGQKKQPDCPVRGPVANRFEQPGLLSLAPKEPKLTPIAPRPPPRFVPVPPRVATKKDESETNHERAAQAGSFASAFSRWETGIGAEDQHMARAYGPSNERRPSAAPMKGYHASCPTSGFGFEPFHPGSGMTRQREMKPSEEIQSSRAFMPSADVRSRQGASSNFRTPSGPERNEGIKIASFGGASSSFVPSAVSADQSESFEATTGAAGSLPDRAASMAPSHDVAYDTFPRAAAVAPRHETKDPDESAVESTDSIRQIPASEDDLGKRTPAFDRWSAAAVLPAEEMKCDSSIDEKLDTEMVAVDHAIETIKRLSLSSNDASFVDPRTNRDANDAFAGLWPMAQEMKGDSSIDDEPYEGDMSSKQSFLPSSFFSASMQNTNAMHRAPNPSSPAHSFCSHISMELRSIPSPVPSSNSLISVEAFSLPSPCNSFSSRCSFEVNSLKHVRMDDSVSPSMFQSDQSADNEREVSHLDGLQPLPVDPQDFVPPTIFVDSSSNIAGPTA